MNFKSPDRQKAWDVLAVAKDGLFSSQVAELIGMDHAVCARKLANMVEVGVLESLPEGTQSNTRRRRYDCKHHEATAKAANEAGRGVTWGLGKASMRTRLKLGQSAGSRAWNSLGFVKDGGKAAASDGVHTKNTKTTVCPPFEDRRFRGEPVPMFSAMKYGEYLDSDSQISRAYA